MPTLNGDTVPYSGVLDAHATGSPTAWGCRLIVDQDGYIDFVPDRQGAAGEDKNRLFDLLEAEIPINVLRDKVGELLRTQQMKTREAKDFTLHRSDNLEVHANTNASGGYCYVIAFIRTPATDANAAALNS